MTSPEDVRAKVRGRITEVLRDHMGDTDPFTDSDSLVLSGRLDSLGVVNLLLFLEEDFALSIDPSDFDQATFDSVHSVVALLGSAMPQS
jgi:acyl carrier protein